MADNSAAGLITRALQAAANGPFFPEWEFATLFGVSRQEVAAAADHVGASAALSGKDVRQAAAGAVNNLLGYPHGRQDLLPQWLSATPAELEAAFRAWSSQDGA